jgi:hypothetical protein
MENRRWVNLAKLLSIPVTGVSDTSDQDYVRIIMTGDKVNIRSLPSSKGEILFQARMGDSFGVKTQTIKAPDGSLWYRILYGEDERGELSEAEGLPGYESSNPYISVTFAKVIPLTLDDEREISRITGVISREAFKNALDARDLQRTSQAATLLAGLPWVVSCANGGTKIYEAPDEKSRVVYSLEQKYLKIVGWADGGPGLGWFHVTDFTDDPPIDGWARSNEISFDNYNLSDYDKDEMKIYPFIYRAYASLGKGREAKEKWGPAITDKHETEDLEGNVTQHTILEFQDIFVETIGDVDGSWESGNLMFSRDGSGIGGVFCGVDWCDKNYVQSVIGKPTETNVEKNGDEVWSYNTMGGSSGLSFTFGTNGIVSAINYSYSSD